MERLEKVHTSHTVDRRDAIFHYVYKCKHIYILSTGLPQNNMISHVLISEVECWEDYNKRMIPIILGAVAAAVCLIAILTYVLVRERRNQGYEQL